MRLFYASKPCIFGAKGYSGLIVKNAKRNNLAGSNTIFFGSFRRVRERISSVIKKCGGNFLLNC
ncbi:hypothetical protein LEP1GSC185_0008 [Leptospira licerasiae serovar Varillal str. VAR 010]|uniref:Uncharacterized protein n=1 Tax=Leptospira licerasiae str. MMD4847 TaxID=1049971 RepID=A0ABN0H9F8_9LEPT|nr:hypothetical protein LEP1GSC185_0008 [Leptospira licerasiae serovar Varillal str. VAR 010]EJZ42240.1 hypothetical protein LEP1GSC178_2363 [Leptospira licerasiae str. MMD4847]TGM86837.1 hypothetical protein EHR05_18065 [Leptospira licerasiae]